MGFLAQNARKTALKHTPTPISTHPPSFQAVSRLSKTFDVTFFEGFPDAWRALGGSAPQTPRKERVGKKAPGGFSSAKRAQKRIKTHSHTHFHPSPIVSGHFETFQKFRFFRLFRVLQPPKTGPNAHFQQKLSANGLENDTFSDFQPEI